MSQRSLEALIQQQSKLAIAFSGGIDSTYLLVKASRILGKENVLAVIVNSELFKESEFEKAQVIARNLDVPFVTTEIQELSEPEIANNTPAGWYQSKKMLYQKIQAVAAEHGFDVVADGMIMDDLTDFRPGLRARNEAGILSPLEQAGLYKTDIRQAAQAEKIPIWNKPASCSVASRFPYYTPITLEKVEQVMAGESYLTEIGFDCVRLRHHGNLARIEVLASELTALVAKREVIIQHLKELGFTYISIDLAGYEMGKMNEELSAENVG